MLDPDLGLPPETELYARAVEAAISSEDLVAASVTLDKCLVSFTAEPRSASEIAFYQNWLQSVIELARSSREHMANRLAATGPSYSRTIPGAAGEKSYRTGWLGILTFVFLLLPVDVRAGEPPSALERQNAAVQRQRQANPIRVLSDGFFQVRWTGSLEREPTTTVVSADAAVTAAAKPVVAAACQPLPHEELQAMVSRMTLGPVTPKLLFALISQESGGNPCAVSKKGAMGLMQLMPDLASDLKVADPFDPEQNLRAGVRYLAQLSEKYNGDWRLALAAYNAGPGRVDAVGRVPEIAETQNYVKSILSKVESED